MSDGMRDSGSGRLFGAQKGIAPDASERGIVISMLAALDRPEMLGLLFDLYNAGYIECTGSYPNVTLRPVVTQRTPTSGEEYEYMTTYGPRKMWFDVDRPPDGKGWRRDTSRGRNGWERFDYHEESYWRRRIPTGEGSVTNDAVVVKHLATNGTEGWPSPLTACSGIPFNPDYYSELPPGTKLELCSGCQKATLRTLNTEKK